MNEWITTVGLAEMLMISGCDPAQVELRAAADLALVLAVEPSAEEALPILQHVRYRR